MSLATMESLFVQLPSKAGSMSHKGHSRHFALQKSSELVHHWTAVESLTIATQRPFKK